MASPQADQLAPAALHSNWVVQKFGGTSVGKFALNIIEQVVEYVNILRNDRNDSTVNSDKHCTDFP